MMRAGVPPQVVHKQRYIICTFDVTAPPVVFGRLAALLARPWISNPYINSIAAELVVKVRPGCKRYLPALVVRFCGRRTAAELLVVDVIRPKHSHPAGFLVRADVPASMEIAVVLVCVHRKIETPLFEVRLTGDRLCLFLNPLQCGHQDGHQ